MVWSLYGRGQIAQRPSTAGKKHFLTPFEGLWRAFGRGLERLGALWVDFWVFVCCYVTCSWQSGPGLDFRGPGAQFGLILERFCRIPGSIFGDI